MGHLVEIITKNHLKTPRNYAARAVEMKPQYAIEAKKYGREYWDGSREIGYGGYYDDGRWKLVATKIVENYNLPQNAKVLDIGCGKGFLLKEILQIRPDLVVCGIDISNYAVENAAKEVKEYLSVGAIEKSSLKINTYDLVLSLNTLHNLFLPELVLALKKIQDSTIGQAYICIESYRNEKEKWNLMRWQLTCEAFYTPTEWEWIFSLAGYKGDYEFIFFE